MACKSSGWKWACLPALATMMVLGAGCYPHEKEVSTTDVVTNRMDRSLQSPRDKHWQQMSDNAMVSDMTLWDYHFVPHTSELSGAGAERLTRMAFYLDTYGGTVRYDTALKDEALIKERIGHAHEFLKVSGADVTRTQIEVALPGGRMFTAAEGIRVSERGTARPEGSGGSTTLIGPAPNP